MTKQKPTEEQVLCFKRELFDRVGAFNGLTTEVDRYLPAITNPQNIFYQDRSAAEQDFTSKQLIPYVIIVKGNQILQYKRGKSGGEQRLHSLHSIGVGGHISNDDGNGESIGYDDAMYREIREEVGYEVPVSPAIAIINTDAVEVGKVHLGVVHVIQLDEESSGAEGFEDCLNDPHFVTIEQLKNGREFYEPWSQICIDHIEKILANAEAQAKCEN